MAADRFGIDLPSLYRDQNALIDSRGRQQLNALALQKGQMDLEQAPVLNALNVKAKKLEIAGQEQSQQAAKTLADTKYATDALGAVSDVPDEQLLQATQAAKANLASKGIGTAAFDQAMQESGGDPAKLRVALKQQAQAGLGYAAQLAQKNADRTFGAQQENTKAVRESTDAYRAATLAQGNQRIQQGQERINQAGAAKAGADADTIKSYGENILNGNAMLQNVPTASRDAVSRYISEQTDATSPLGAQRSTMAASRITAPYTNLSQYKLASDAQPYLQRIDAASKTPGPVADQDMLDSLTKLNTGGNAITDAQVSLITDHKSYADALDVFAKKFKAGGSLSDSMRKQIVDISHAIAANYLKGYQPVYEAASAQLKAAGIKPQFWTIPDLSKFAVAAPDVSESKTIGGVTYHKVNGQWMQ